MNTIALFFPKDSEAIFNKNSRRTFGGATVQMHLIAQELARYEGLLTAHTIIPTYPEIDHDETYRYNLVPAYDEKENILSKILHVHRAIKKIKPEVVLQVGLTVPSCLLAVYCRFFGIKFIFMFAHDVESTRRFQYNEKKCHLFPLLIAFSHHLIVQNMKQFDDITRLCRNASKKISILYNGFPLKETAVKKNAKKVLWVARSDKWKRPELFIELARRNSDADFTMICSNAGDDAFYEKIRESARQVKNLTFLDFIPFNKIDSYFEDAGIFVNTSDYEGYPQTFIQAAMNSVPVISLNTNPDNYITDYRCGWFCGGNFDLLQEKLRELIDDPEAYKTMSMNSFRYHLEKHNIHKNVSDLLDICMIRNRGRHFSRAHYVAGIEIETLQEKSKIL